LATAYNNKAYDFYKEGKNLEEGLELVEKAILLDPKEGVFLSTKAELLYKMGRYQEAYEYIKRGIALKPNHPEIQQDFKMIEEAVNKQNK
jgi:tetratricopeptide (TPR) repeat protein